MSERQAWPGQPYLDELRPDRLEVVRLALIATYSLDLSAVAATLLALIGRNNDRGSGTAVDFADAIERLRDRVRIIIQRGRIARPSKLPRVAGILDQFVIEQPYDERVRSWHPKIALVAYAGPKDEVRWKLWIGSRNLTRSQDLDAGLLLDGHVKRGKARVKLPGIGQVGATLARAAARADADAIAAELDAIWWAAPDGFELRAVLNGLGEGVPLSLAPPNEPLAGITIVSPFLSPEMLKTAGSWGPPGSRTIISSMPALVDMANRPSKPLAGFSNILAYAAPEKLADETAATMPGGDPAAEDDAEPAPLGLHAKIFCFHVGETTVFRVGSANATDRAWSGRNAEIMIELAGAEAFNAGLKFLIGKATPVTLPELEATPPSDATEADALEQSRKALLASWNPILRRDGDQFAIDAQSLPSLAIPEHQLEAGHANGGLLPWPAMASRLDLGLIPLPLQSAFIQVQITGPASVLRWMQRVTVEPPLEEKRDLAALASHMGLRAFHDWMRAMLSGDAIAVGDTAWDDDGVDTRNNRAGPNYDRLTLEDILTAWARDNTAFGRADRHFSPYVDALLAHGRNLTEIERRDLRELAKIWAIARAQLAS